MPWGVVFPKGSLVHQAQQSAGLVGFADAPLPVHPTQLYEAFAELALFGFLLWIRPLKKYDGQLLLLWLGSYAVMRSVIEVYRGDVERGVAILSTSQYVSIGIMLVTLVMYWHLRRRRRQQTMSL